jgi:hypothetical protein
VKGLPICPLCHGLHREPPECLGRPQTEVEWMVDRGVRPERAQEIVDARARLVASGHALPSMVQPPDPDVVHVPPYGSPLRSTDHPTPCAPTPEQDVQEALF